MRMYLHASDKRGDLGEGANPPHLSSLSPWPVVPIIKVSGEQRELSKIHLEVKLKGSAEDRSVTEQRAELPRNLEQERV